MTVGRPLEFDPDMALEAAMQLFWRKGYESSSLQDLMSAMGLSKSSFYQTFKSKHSLFQQAITHYREAMTDEMTMKLNKARSGKTFIETLFRSIASETAGPDERRGCLLMNTASEFAQTDPDIATLVTASIDAITNVFELAIQQAQEQGNISSEKNAHTLATYLVSSMSGLRSMVKAGANRKTISRITTVTLAALDTDVSIN